jgi:hypothetical protein
MEHPLAVYHLLITSHYAHYKDGVKIIGSKGFKGSNNNSVLIKGNIVIYLKSFYIL